jgi:hypothetical protein
VESAPDNLQLACYAAMKWLQRPVKFTGVALVQPRNFGPRLSQALYSDEHIRAASIEIATVFHESEKQDAPLNASQEACHFCKAKTFCPAYTKKFNAIQEVGVRALDTVTNDELERLKEALQFAEKIKDSVNDELRKRITDGKMPGWELRNKGDTREVINALGFYQNMAHLVTAKEFDDCRVLGWGKLEELIQSKTGFGPKKTKELIKELSEKFVLVTPMKKSPVRSKKA